MNSELKGKTAVVTGGSSGLGAAVVRTLVDRGARVGVIARNPARLKASLAGLGDAVIGLHADIGDPRQVADAFAEFGSTFGPLNFLVNNAGAGLYYPVDRLPDDEISAEVAVNFVGHILCVRSAIPLMRRAGGGVIVNVSSESSQQPVHGLALYGACKAALEAFSLAINQELRADRIKSTVLRLGRMKDAGFSKGWPTDMRAEAVERWQQGGRFASDGEPMDLDFVAKTLVGLLTVPPAAQMRVVDLREFDAGV
jgi:NAD(P)-dependent dehydrogenase (short-subunit alcohol dehydrogenase family)